MRMHISLKPWSPLQTWKAERCWLFVWRQSAWLFVWRTCISFSNCSHGVGAEKHDGEYFQSFLQRFTTDIFMFMSSVIAEVDWALSVQILVNVVCARKKGGGGCGGEGAGVRKEKNSELPPFYGENCLVFETLYLSLANDSTHFRHTKNNKQAK